MSCHILAPDRPITAPPESIQCEGCAFLPLVASHSCDLLAVHTLLSQSSLLRNAQLLATRRIQHLPFALENTQSYRITLNPGCPFPTLTFQ